MWKSRRVRGLETERDEANAALQHMMGENMELTKRLRETEGQLSRAAARNVNLVVEKDRAMAELERSLDRYRELRDRMEKLAHRIEEMTGEMIGSVHEL